MDKVARADLEAIDGEVVGEELGEGEKEFVALPERDALGDEL